MHRQRRHGTANGCEKSFRRLLFQRLLPSRNSKAVRQQMKSAAALRRSHGIAEGNGLHHHPQLMIAVRPAAQNIQRQIDLGRSLFLCIHRIFRASR